MRRGPEITPFFTKEQRELISQKYESAGLGAETEKKIEIRHDSPIQESDDNSAGLQKADELDKELIEVE